MKANPTKPKEYSTIQFKAKLFAAKTVASNESLILLTLPIDATAKLPSRGMVSVEGEINSFPFTATLEPDGNGSHWLRVSKQILKTASLEEGDVVALKITPTQNEPEPEVPADLRKALVDSPKAQKLWLEITPMARRDWIRWIDTAKLAKTRARRIEVACSKLNSGMRRPCCYNYLCPIALVV